MVKGSVGTTIKKTLSRRKIQEKMELHKKPGIKVNPSKKRES